MKRREFMAASCLAGLAPLSMSKPADAAESCDTESCDAPNKEFYELRLYSFASTEKRDEFSEFLGKAAIPALNRLGISPVGVFQLIEDGDTIDLYVLLPSACPATLLSATTQLLKDETYLKDGAAVIGSPKSDPAFKTLESSLLLAFDEIPKTEIPTKKASRIFQLRIYQAHNAERGKKKVAMFNNGELQTFRATGMNPVFFGEALVGTKVPNLTYMLGFDDMAAKEEAWKKFLVHPKWNEMKNDPQYKDTVSHITNLMLRPAACSQI